MSALSETERGRDAYARRAWASAYESLASAEALAAPDLELLAVAAYMLGRVDEYLRALEQAHDAYLAADALLPAARAAVYLGVNLALLGEIGQLVGGSRGRSGSSTARTSTVRNAAT